MNVAFPFSCAFSHQTSWIFPYGSRYNVRALGQPRNRTEESLIGYPSMSLRRWIGGYGMSHAQRQTTANNRSFTETRGEPSMKSFRLRTAFYLSLPTRHHQLDSGELQTATTPYYRFSIIRRLVISNSLEPPLTLVP